MARFVSRHLNYRHGARVGREMVLADGQRQTLERHLAVKFEKAASILTEDEIKFGMDNLTFQGLPIDKNTNSHASPRIRMSGFDTVLAQEREGWTDEERMVVEDALRGSDDFGVAFVEIPAQRVQKPWATYEDTPVAQLLDLAAAVGVSVEDVLAFEKQNQNRETVVFLLEDAIANSTPAEADEAAVVIEA